MKNLILPPKRFERVTDSKYDPIRFRDWFGQLATRRLQIPFLEMAAKEVAEGKLIQDAAVNYGIDRRELTDYLKFIAGKGNEITATQQKMIDMAYGWYCLDHGQSCWRGQLKGQAKIWGTNPRHLVELWEVHPNYYPSNYVYRNKIGS